jgi:hypothetical protein
MGGDRLDIVCKFSDAVVIQASVVQKEVLLMELGRVLSMQGVLYL